METLKNNIRLVTFLAPVVADEDSEPTSSIVDTREVAAEAGSPSFDGALIRAKVGTFGANLDSVAITIEESNDDDFSDNSETVAEGGAEQTLTEAGELIFQIRRTKRYLRAVVDMTASGSADTAPMSIDGILHNWAKPFPIV